MTAPSELSVDAVRKFMVDNGGKVTNHDLVKHFKHFLTNPENRAEARNHFKEIVNVVATIRTEEGEKFLVLKRKFRDPEDDHNMSQISSSAMLSSYPSSPPAYESVCSFSPTSFNQVVGMGPRYNSPPPSDPMSPSRAPPPYRAPPPPVVSPPRPVGHHHQPMPIPPPPVTNKSRPPPITALLSEEAIAAELARRSSIDSLDSMEDPSIAPPVPPRRKSSVKSLKLEGNKENNSENLSDQKRRPKSEECDSKRNSLAESEAEHKISVRDAMQKFNRLASESEQLRSHVPVTASALRKKPDKSGGSSVDDDAVSVTSLDPKSREWLVRASQCQYQILHKLSAENPRLATFKDPTSGYTALHWAAKHGSEDVVKLIAGTHQADVNVRSNGGYTPLHIAMQFGHEEIHNLLVQVYGADPNLRDWSGRKPRQYQMSQGTSVSADTFRSEYRLSRASSLRVDLRGLGVRSMHCVTPPSSPAGTPLARRHRSGSMRLLAHQVAQQMARSMRGARTNK